MASSLNGSYLQQAQVDAYTPVYHESASSTQYTNPVSEQPAQPAPAAEAEKTQPGKDEVGWLFVEQYYTTLHKAPEKLHLFYNRKSTMVWGDEGETVETIYGRQNIASKIAERQFVNCKVHITNVDSQASLDNSIIILVIGEMSSDDKPEVRKFAQNFFLAEQPGGYFVLNDSLRFLSEPAYEEEEEEVEGQVEGDEENLAAAEAAIAEAEAGQAELDNVQAVEADVAELEGEAKFVESTDTPVVTNGVVDEAVGAPTAPEAEVKEEEQVAEEPAPAPAEEEPAAEPEPEPAEEAPAVEETPAPAPEPEAAPAPAPKEEKPTPPPPAVPAAPAKPKTWANLVALNAKPPVPAVPLVKPAASPAPSAGAASETPAAAAAPATSASPAPKTESSAAAPSPSAAGESKQSDGWQTADRRHSKASSAPSGDLTLAYIRNVTESVDATALKEALLKFGPLKQFEISKQRNCAFVEFATPGAFKAAVAANPHVIGDHKLNVEERRSRNTNAPPYGNRPSFQGGRGEHRSSPSQGRGGFQREGGRFEGRGGRGGSRGGFGGRGRGGAPATSS